MKVGDIVTCIEDRSFNIASRSCTGPRSNFIKIGEKYKITRIVFGSLISDAIEDHYYLEDITTKTKCGGYAFYHKRFIPNVCNLKLI